MEGKMTLWSYIVSWLTAMFGALTLQDVALWVGISTAIGTFLVNWYYNRRRTLFVEGKL